MGEESAIVGREIVVEVAGNEYHDGCATERAYCHFGFVGIGIGHDGFEAIENSGIVDYADFPRLLVLSVRGVDAALDDSLEGLAGDGVGLIGSNAATLHDGGDCWVFVLRCLLWLLRRIVACCECNEGEEGDE